MWNTYEFSAQKAVLKPAQIQPGRVPITTCSYSPDGRLIAGGLADGSLQVWNASGKMASAAVGLILPPKQQKHIVNTWAYSKSPKHVIRGVRGISRQPSSFRLQLRPRSVLGLSSDVWLCVRRS